MAGWLAVAPSNAQFEPSPPLPCPQGKLPAPATSTSAADCQSAAKLIADELCKKAARDRGISVFTCTSTPSEPVVGPDGLFECQATFTVNSAECRQPTSPSPSGGGDDSGGFGGSVGGDIDLDFPDDVLICDGFCDIPEGYVTIEDLPYVDDFSTGADFGGDFSTGGGDYWSGGYGGDWSGGGYGGYGSSGGLGSSY